MAITVLLGGIYDAGRVALITRRGLFRCISKLHEYQKYLSFDEGMRVEIPVVQLERRMTYE